MWQSTPTQTRCILGCLLVAVIIPIVNFVVHEQQDEEQSIDCPECHKGHLVARRGRQGKIFYGCDNFPHCKFSLPAKPYAMPCPQCHFPLALLKSENAEQQVWQCANKGCRHIFENEK